FDELFANGTTTGCVYSSSHMEATDAFFAESERRGARMAAGKTMMDRNAPAGVLDTAKRGYDESRALIERWHGRGRQIYAVTPRFAITSSPEQLEAAGALARENPTCLVQTHLSENHAEIAAVEGLFPHALDYTDVYEGFGLVGPRTLLGHCIHLDVREWRALSERGAVAVHCPTSNLFLGSGLFDLAAAREAARPVRVAVATDVGGGTSYSMLRTMAEAYKVQQLRGLSVAPRDAFHMATRGNALAMGLGGTVGGLDAGHEADFVVLDSRATPAMAQRMATARTLDEELFVLMTLGDDRAVAETYVAGRPSKPRGDRAIE
ncbi:MAG: guanine deaminase, partial [Hyphomicrobiales bacterium]|nr:guanine deaminase [Hyphomicrobiales bacterium]